MFNIVVIMLSLRMTMTTMTRMTPDVATTNDTLTINFYYMADYLR